MDFGKAVGTACSSFAITNIDDLFVLVTFFAEASTSKILTPLRITVGQYVGFTILVVISLIGFGASLLFPSEPIGFLGLLPPLLGSWSILGLLLKPKKEETEDPGASSLPLSADGVSSTAKTWMKSIVKVASITIMNGADNIGTYVPLFSQAKGAEIAVYVITYYILLGLWCGAAFLVMKQRHILRVAQKYAGMVVPFLYIGLGIFIIIKSKCYPWSIERIDNVQPAHPGTAILASVTAALLSLCIGIMIWFKLRERSARRTVEVEAAGPVSHELDSPIPGPPRSSGQPQAQKEDSAFLTSSDSEKVDNGKEVANVVHEIKIQDSKAEAPGADSQTDGSNISTKYPDSIEPSKGAVNSAEFPETKEH